MSLVHSPWMRLIEISRCGRVPISVSCCLLRAEAGLGGCLELISREKR